MIAPVGKWGSGEEMARVAFLGLGAMGFHMAGHVARSGHDVAVYNRTAAKADAWVTAHGGRAFATAGEAVHGADFVCACVGNDDALRAVTLGEEGAFTAMKPGAIFIDHTTATAGIARELAAEATKRELAALDAPVSGGQIGAKNGQLTVMVGGDPAAFARAEPIIRSYAKAVTLMGPPGAGQLTKMVNQICIAGLMQALAEGINFAIKAGLDVERVLSVIAKGSAQSWTMENRGPSMARGEFKPGFTVDWMRKDLGICLGEARRNGASLPVTEQVDRCYAEIQRRGGGGWDNSSLIDLLRRQ